LRKDMNQHNAEVCPVNCERCGQVSTRALLKTHDSSCPKLPVRISLPILRISCMSSFPLSVF
jgi:hypothetical protein